MCRWLIAASLMMCGCVAQTSTPTGSNSKATCDRRAACFVQAKPKRQFTEKQIDALRSFALSESPQLWQTVQMIKAESLARKATMNKLCKEMQDFGRDPDDDPDVAALKSAQIELEGSLATIYMKLEDAYIAYKKMLATPGHKEYADAMRTALEDGIKEGDMTTARFKDMSRNKWG